MSADEFQDPEEAARESSAAQQEADEELRAQFIGTFSSPGGQATLLSLCDFCRHMQGNFFVDDVNGRRQAYWEGRRSVYLMILKHLTMDDFEIIERMRAAALRAQARTE